MTQLHGYHMKKGLQSSDSVVSKIMFLLIVFPLLYFISCHQFLQFVSVIILNVTFLSGTYGEAKDGVEDAANLSSVHTQVTLGKRQSKPARRYRSSTDSEDSQPQQRKGIAQS